MVYIGAQVKNMCELTSDMKAIFIEVILVSHSVAKQLA